MITRQKINGVECFKSIDGALEECKGDIWFIGGAGIYEEAMGKADLIDMTLVPDRVSGDDCVYFPNIDDNWKEGETEPLKDSTKLLHKIYTRRV